MRFSAAAWVSAIVLAIQVSTASAVTVQSASNVFNGNPFLYVEAEDFSSLVDEGALDNGWKVVTKGGPDMSTIVNTDGTSLPVLPNDSNVSGTAIWSQANQFSLHEDVAQYELQFVTPGTYQFYLRYTLFDSGTTTAHFLNEDSIFLPPAFNKNSHSDWIGAAVSEFDDNDVEVDVPVAGEALDPDGYKPSVGDHQNEGLLELVFGRWKSAEDAGGSSDDIVPGNGHMDSGHFDWYNRPTFTGATEAGGFDGFYGVRTEYTVTPEMVGEVVTFEIGIREVNVTIDSFAFIQTSNIYPNMDILDLYTQEELQAGLLPQVLEADFDGDGLVGGADFLLWQRGVGLTGQTDNSNGDADGDGSVGAADFGLWQTQYGTSAVSAASSAVPEPATGAMMMLLAGTGLAIARRRMR